SDSRLALQEISIRLLARCRYDLLTLDDEVRALDRHRTPPPLRIGLAERHALELDAADATVLLDDTHGPGEKLELDALVLGVVDLAVVRAHLLARPPVHHSDLCAEPA